MIALTETATSKAKQLMEARCAPELYLRVAVRPGGCSGLSYEMFFDTEKAADDVTVTYADGDVLVVVDPARAQYLAGASLDYKDGLQDAGFTINNPNAQRTCGCGQSFSWTSLLLLTAPLRRGRCASASAATAPPRISRPPTASRCCRCCANGSASCRPRTG